MGGRTAHRTGGTDEESALFPAWIYVWTKSRRKPAKYAGAISEASQSTVFQAVVRLVDGEGRPVGLSGGIGLRRGKGVRFFSRALLDRDEGRTGAIPQAGRGFLPLCGV